ncbi:hypothetical protein E2562_027589 [Oryza meyeriana var. granulata]|uniref:BTB domain-containing protein n=1 Tax=Oryza meyeriana var. granulata TaxID=110450 RepID=A0A6G1DP54_9ORYZ|nr:hypothetical protein E2562_027589 [Oryza meyeriana var. granulata]
MSNKQDHTDVCFEVDGEKFNAHRLVMAAQSEVFRALLLGSMAESKMDTIPIHEISASTFKHMLHYIYCNQLPAADDDVDHVSRMTELQHLLVAADMYGVDTLKQLCEATLCAGINKDTVTSTLALTEDGSYRKLRASCIEFLSKTQIFAVATTDEFCQVVQSYPDVLTEIRDRFQKPRLSPNLTPSKRPRLSAKLTPSTDTEEDQNQP